MTFSFANFTSCMLLPRDLGRKVPNLKFSTVRDLVSPDLVVGGSLVAFQGCIFHVKDSGRQLGSDNGFNPGVNNLASGPSYAPPRASGCRQLPRAG